MLWDFRKGLPASVLGQVARCEEEVKDYVVDFRVIEIQTIWVFRDGWILDMCRC